MGGFVLALHLFGGEFWCSVWCRNTSRSDRLFDAVIDNTTRKLVGEGTRSLSGGFWFSLGHSSVVFEIGRAHV